MLKLAEYHLNGMTIGGVMIVFGTGMAGYIGDNDMTINDITTVEEIVIVCWVVYE